MFLSCCCPGLMPLLSQWPGSCSQEVSSCSLVWPSLTYSVCLRGLSVSFPPLAIKMSPPFSMLSQRLLDPPHRRGDLVSTAWRWIKDWLAMAVRGRKAQMDRGMQQKELCKGGNRESVLSLCDGVCCGKLCNLFKWVPVCSQSRAVRPSLTHPGTDWMYQMTIEFPCPILLSKDCLLLKLKL